jgi:fatty-acyl-CoA synthase
VRRPCCAEHRQGSRRPSTLRNNASLTVHTYLAVLCQHAAVSEACVIGAPYEKWGETIKAVVVVRSDSPLSEADLITFCRERMAHFKCPTSVEIRDGLIRTATGKLQKFKLREPYWQSLERKVY